MLNKPVNVGDKVLWTYSRGYYGSEKIATVVKITPTGRITLDNGHKFYADGQVIGKEFLATEEISDLTNEDIERINRTNVIVYAKNLMRKEIENSKLSYEKAVKIVEILKQ